MIFSVSESQLAARVLFMIHPDWFVAFCYLRITKLCLRFTDNISSMINRTAFFSDTIQCAAYQVYIWSRDGYNLA